MTESHLDQIKRLPVRPLEVWQGALIEIPIPDAGNARGPICAAWCDVSSGMVHMGPMLSEETASPTHLWECLVAFALRSKEGDGHLPGRLEVISLDEVELLQARLAGIGVEVVRTDDLRAIDKIVDEMEQILRENPPESGPAGDLSIASGRGVSIDGLRSFAEASAAFFNAEPWMHFANDDLVEIESPKPPKGMKFMSVMGAGRQTTGLGFFTNRKAFENMNRMAAKDLLEASSQTMWSLQFDDEDGTPPEDVLLWESLELPLAAKNAYPFPSGFKPADHSFIRPSAQLRFMEALMRALAETSEEQIDSGRWTVKIQTGRGPVKVTLSLPGLLGSAGKQKKPRRADAPRSMMDLTDELSSLIAEYAPANAEEAERLVAQHLSGELPTNLKPKGDVAKKSAQERAMVIYFEAAQAQGRKQLQLIREALEVDPDCAAAYVLMGERASDPHTALKHFRLAHEAGLRTLGDRIERDAGNFWLMHDTRPFMRAKYGMAHALIHVGSIASLTEAAELLRQLLVLNPNDNQGVRYLYPGTLMRLEKDAEAARFMKAQSDEPSAQWTYLRALLAFRLGGDCEASRMELKKAVDANPHMVELLQKSPAELPPSPASYAPGSADEALCCLDEIGLLNDDSPGATEWIIEQGKAFVPAKRRR